MTSNKPYILRALFEWIVDNNLTPYLLVNAYAENVMAPEGIENDGKIVFNLSLSAIRDFEMTNEAVFFSARFQGKPENIYLPTASILAIYANENGEGMMFPEEQNDNSVAKQEAPEKKTRKKPTRKKPSLSIVAQTTKND